MELLSELLLLMFSTWSFADSWSSDVSVKNIYRKFKFKCPSPVRKRIQARNATELQIGGKPHPFADKPLCYAEYVAYNNLFLHNPSAFVRPTPLKFWSRMGRTVFQTVSWFWRKSRRIRWNLSNRFFYSLLSRGNKQQLHKQFHIILL
jgi:hypothetical protein